MTAALVVQDLQAGYEPGLPIVRGAALTLAAGEIVALLGPNGAGKSTLVKAVAGLVPISGGRVWLGGPEGPTCGAQNGAQNELQDSTKHDPTHDSTHDPTHDPTHGLQDITALAAHLRVHRGLAFVPQTENVFAGLSVAENLELAAALMKGVTRHKRDERLAPVYAMFPDLLRQRALLAGRLSGGQRQMLAVARALIARPRVLMLDEPSAGLSPKLVAQVFDKLAEVRASGVALLLVEQNVKAALALADRAIVLVEGRERLVAAAQGLASDPRLAQLYLGRQVDEHAAQNGVDVQTAGHTAAPNEGHADRHTGHRTDHPTGHPLGGQADRQTSHPTQGLP